MYVYNVADNKNVLFFEYMFTGYMKDCAEEKTTRLRIIKLQDLEERLLFLRSKVHAPTSIVHKIRSFINYITKHEEDYLGIKAIFCK